MFVDDRPQLIRVVCAIRCGQVMIMLTQRLQKNRSIHHFGGEFGGNLLWLLLGFQIFCGRGDEVYVAGTFTLPSSNADNAWNSVSAELK